MHLDDPCSSRQATCGTRRRAGRASRKRHACCAVPCAPCTGAGAGAAAAAALGASAAPARHGASDAGGSAAHVAGRGKGSRVRKTWVDGSHRITRKARHGEGGNVGPLGVRPRHRGSPWLHRSSGCQRRSFMTVHCMCPCACACALLGQGIAGTGRVRGESPAGTWARARPPSRVGGEAVGGGAAQRPTSAAAGGGAAAARRARASGGRPGSSPAGYAAAGGGEDEEGSDGGGARAHGGTVVGPGGYSALTVTPTTLLGGWMGAGSPSRPPTAGGRPLSPSPTVRPSSRPEQPCRPARAVPALP